MACGFRWLRVYQDIGFFASKENYNPFRLTIGQNSGRRLQGHLVPVRAEAADHAGRRFGDIAFMAKRLALKNIGQMHLDHRQIGAPQGVQESHRCVRVGAGIDDDGSRAIWRALNPVDQLALRVALPEIDAKAEVCPLAPAQRFDIGKRLAAINLRLAGAQHIQVGTVQYQDSVRHVRRYVRHNSLSLKSAYRSGMNEPLTNPEAVASYVR